MNFCPECGVPLNAADKTYAKQCRNGHDLEKVGLAPDEHTISTGKEMQVWQVDREGGVSKGVKRKLPETEEERQEAYKIAFARLSKFFEQQGFVAYVSDFDTLMVGKGRFTMDVKIVENNGRTAYVTSGANYNPNKAGTRESGAQIVTSRTVMKARELLRITVTGSQSLPIFVELRKNIPDPELHICKSVLFVLQQATTGGSALNSALQNTKFLSNVPPEWVPKPSEYDALFGVPPEAAGLLR